MSHADESGMVSSSMTYSKVMRLIEDDYGIPVARPNPREALINAVRRQFCAAVREECRRTAEETAFRIFRLAAAHLPDVPEDGLYVPASQIQINSGDVGLMRLRPFRQDGWPGNRRKSARVDVRPVHRVLSRQRLDSDHPMR